MKTLQLFIFSFFTLSIISNAQTVIPPGDVSGTWAIGGSPYEIQGEITIPDGLTLTIEPGVTVEFQGHYKLNVQGRLFAIGTENDTIVFTLNDTTGFHDPNIPDGGWAGIRFINVFSLIDSSSIIYCKIEYGKALGFWPDNTGGAICVDGFDKLTIANCLITNNIASVTDGSGGGIALWNSSPVIIDNFITNNIAQFGGGVQCYESSPLIENNFLEFNSAQSGGGIVCNEYSNPTIINTNIENNTAINNGGGIVCWNNCSLVLDNAMIYNNSATGNGGGGISTHNCNLQIDNCTFIENDVYGAGGAISFSADTSYTGLPYQVAITNTSFLENTAYSRAGVFINNWGSTPLIIDVTIDKCEFLNNVSDHYTGLSVYNSSISISNSVFSGNTAVTYTAAAGFSSGCIGTISNCLFASNVASTGGGGWNSGGLTVWTDVNADIMNCTFVNNSAEYGAGLTVGSGGTATLTNCIFWGNSDDQIALDTYNNNGGTLFVNYCDIQGGEDSVNVIDPLLSTLNWGIGNKDVDPAFENSGIGDYHLQDTSPCIGAAIDSMEINGNMCYCPLFDIEGNPRPDPPGSMPDIGACESPLANPVGVEEDLSVNPTEYALSQNYPNPFNPTTTIKYSVPKLSFVTIKIYDVLGSEITTLVNEEKPIGSYEVEFDADGLTSGVYFYRLQAGFFVETKKMV
ncbi:MAG: right-handed parallel beta-helix repeat-containing protein, partial [Ignavibacteriaceae bacterium]